jgi:hypothetical protein
MIKTFALSILLIIGSLTVAAQPLTDFRTVSEDQHSVVLEFTPHVIAEHVIGNRGTIFTRFRFYASQTAFDSTGQADFSRNILLLFPSTRYSVQILRSEYQIRDSIKLLPKPTLKSLKDFGFTETYDESKFIQDARSSAQHPLAEVVRLGKTSIGYTGTLLLRPVQVMENEQVRVYSKIVVRLEFKDGFLDGMRSTSLLRGDIPRQDSYSQTMQTPVRKNTAGNSPFSQGDWYRFDVTEAGLYKLDYSYLRKLNISVSDMNSIRIFGNGGLVIPDNTTDARPDSLVEIPRLVVRKNAGRSDTSDYIVFYGRGVRGWQYNGFTKQFQHYINPYTEKNCYFFTVSQTTGKSMDTSSAPSGSLPAVVPTSFQEKILVDSVRTNLLKSGRRWFGKKFTAIDNSDTYYNSLPGIVSNTQVNYAFNFVRRSASTDYLNIYESGKALLQQVSMFPTGMGIGETEPYADDLPITVTGGVPQSNPNSSVVKIQIVTSNSDANTWLDWLEISYQRKFEALNDALIFTTPDASGSVQYSVNNLSTEIRAFDITDHSGVKQIKYTPTGPSCTFQLQQTAGSVRQIALVGKNGYKTPPTATKVETFIPANLHDLQDQIDFIIIAPNDKDFISEANRLKAYRQSHDSLRTLVVNIQQIYNEFSGGLPDPLSIREFLKYTQDTWATPKPRYVLLFGNGHYDYKNISTGQPNWIPPFEPDESFETVFSFPSDDKFIMLGASESYAMAIGRLPVRTLKEATIVVNKILSYESSPLDPWRNRITFVADDGKKGVEGDDGAVYTDHSEGISETNALKSFEKNKIYIVEYPTVNSASGRTKPDANKAIVDAINSGTIMTNYIGHGNARLWAHESIFVRESDLPRLINKEMLTFTVTASCSYGWYDDPVEPSGAELLVTMEQGGAIADFTAARVVYDEYNFALDVALFDYLLQKNSVGQYPRIGDACLYAKSINSNASNTQKFHLFGDPTMRLLMPKSTATIDSINGASVSVRDIIKIKSLGHARIAGTVQQNSSIMTSFNGTGTLQLFDSEKDVSMEDGIGLFQFKVAGSLLYRGDVSITNGRFEAMVPVPKDVTIGKSARISMYVWSGQSDGTGSTEQVMIDGIDTTIAKDTVGPVMAVYLDTTAFYPGGVVNSNPVILVQLADESGINTSTVGVGHQLSATLSNPVRTFDLSGYYHSNLDTYKKGEVRYPLTGLSDGHYTLHVKAWDIQNNSSEAETFFEVHSADDFAMLNAVNYPNPFSHSTTFTFQRTSSDPIEVQIKIYTIAGRLIGTIDMPMITDRFVRIPWDGKDNDGSTLANGIYFYKLIAHELNGQRTSETIGKLAVMK